KLIVETARSIVRQKEIFGKKTGHGQVLVRCIPGVQRFKSNDSSQESYQLNNCLTETPCAMCSDARRPGAKSREPTPRISFRSRPGPARELYRPPALVDLWLVVFRDFGELHGPAGDRSAETHSATPVRLDRSRLQQYRSGLPVRLRSRLAVHRK